MSQAADHISTLVDMLNKHSATPLPVIETFYELVTNQNWTSEAIIDFLNVGKGVSEDSDKILEEFIALEKSY